jgi:hypothetical protein
MIITGTRDKQGKIQMKNEEKKVPKYIETEKLRRAQDMYISGMNHRPQNF